MIVKAKDVLFISAGLMLFSMSSPLYAAGTAKAPILLSGKNPHTALKATLTILTSKTGGSSFQNDQDDRIKYSATDSTKVDKGKSTIALYGKANLSCKRLSVTADEIIFNRKTQKLTAKNYKMVNHLTGESTSGTYGEFTLDAKI